MIRRVDWTAHARQRLHERGLTVSDVEAAVRAGHDSRQINRGEADWRVYGFRSDGRRFAVVYDHPASGDRRVVRIVTAWTLRD